MSIQDHFDILENIWTPVNASDVRMAILGALENTYETASKNGNANMEVERARGNHSTLNDRLEEVDEKQDETTTQLAQTDQQKADKTEVQTGLNEKRDKSVPIGLNSVGTDLLAALENKTDGTSFDILSIPRPNSVSPDKATFVAKSTNLFNQDAISEQGLMIDTYGTVVSDSSYTFSDYIEVIPSKVYYFYGFFHVAEYDIDKKFIGKSTIVSSGEALETSEECYYVRLNYQHGQQNFNGIRQVNEGTELMPYEEWYQYTEEDLPASSLTNGTVKNASVEDGTLSMEKMRFMKTGENLFNHDTVTERTVISGSGVVSDNRQYHTSDFIWVKPSTDYSSVGVTYVAEYDKDGQFIQRISTLTAGATWKTTRKTHFVRAMYMWNSTISGKGLTMINEGMVLKPYEDYYVRFEEGLGIDVLNKVLDESVDRPMIDIPINEVYEEVSEYPEITDFGGNVSSADVYQLFDNLVAQHPDYLKVIETTVDDFGNDIKAYSTILQKPETDVKTKYPKIFITTGTHGYEHPSAMYLYFLIKSLCERWDASETLEVFRWNVEWVFIPVVNPSGWDDYTRKTRNGVDINRNFPQGFTLGNDPTSITYGGPEPLSEPESRFVKSIFDEHTDIDIMYDFHNYSGTPETTSFIWIPTSQGEKVQHMVQMLVSRMTRKWRKEYGWFPQDDEYFVGSSDSTSGGMIADYARSLGIEYSATFEVAGRWWLTDDAGYSVLHKQTGMEAFVNWLQISLLELTR